MAESASQAAIANECALRYFIHSHSCLSEVYLVFHVISHNLCLTHCTRHLCLLHCFETQLLQSGGPASFFLHRIQSHPQNQANKTHRQSRHPRLHRAHQESGSPVKKTLARTTRRYHRANQSQWQRKKLQRKTMEDVRLGF